jgi:homocysteine S-methyltransferase
MSTHRTAWPSHDTAVVTDAGLETWLLFHRHVDLPAFAAYPLAVTADGRAHLDAYYDEYAAIARSVGAAVVLETPTWRANPGWAATLGHDHDELATMITACVEIVARVRDRWVESQPFIVSGTVGPRGDGYRIDQAMEAEAATDYHSFQIGHMAAAGVDVITAMTLGYVEEAIGVVRAANDAGLLSVISFTLETDGRLPSGMTLADAITTTDAATGGGPHHYMINCAHPTHFEHVLDGTAGWAQRIGGLRANASALSHAELDEMVDLDDGDPADLAAQYVALRDRLPALQVIGGCCGTDGRHVAAIAAAWQTASAR